MGQILGKNTLTGVATSASATSEKLLYGVVVGQPWVGQEIILAPNQKLVSANIAWAGKTTNPTGSPVFQVGIYDITGDGATPDLTTAPRIAAYTFSFNNADHSLPAHWISQVLDEDYSAHAGKKLAIGFAAPANLHAFDVLIETITGAFRKNDTGAATTLPATLALGSVVSNQAWGIFFKFEDIGGGGLSLDSVSPSSVTNVGQITGVISGNAASGAVNLISGAISVAQSVVSWTYNAGTNKTTVVSNVVQGGLPFGEVDVEYVVGGGGGTLTGTTDLDPISGNIAVTISGAQDEPGYIFEDLDVGDYLDIDQIEHTDSPNTVVLPTGEIQQTIIRSFSARARDSSDDTWGSFSTINPGIPATAQPSGVAAAIELGAATATGAAIAVAVGQFINIRLGSAVAHGDPDSGDDSQAPGFVRNTGFIGFIS